jgi:hypothetical protein
VGQVVLGTTRHRSRMNWRADRGGFKHMDASVHGHQQQAYMYASKLPRTVLATNWESAVGFGHIYSKNYRMCRESVFYIVGQI